MRKHGGTPSRRDKHVTLAAISPPGVARGRFVGGQQSGLAGCKPPPLFTRGASSCSSQGRRQGEPWGASPRPSAPTYLPQSSEALAKEAFQCIDVRLDLSMHTAGVLEGCSLRDYHAQYKCVLNSLSDGLEARLIHCDRWCKDKQYLYYEDRIVMPEAGLDGCLQWAHLSSGHTGCNRCVDFFRERCYSPLTCAELRAPMQSIVDSCGCHASKQSNSRDRGVVSSLPIPYCAKSLLYVDFIHGLPNFGGDDSCLVVTCGLTRFTHAFRCNKKITGEQPVKIFVKQWLPLWGT